MWVAKEKNTDYIVALKKMDRKQLEKYNYIEQVKREVVIQSTLRHPRLLELYGYFCD